MGCCGSTAGKYWLTTEERAGMVRDLEKVKKGFQDAASDSEVLLEVLAGYLSPTAHQELATLHKNAHSHDMSKDTTGLVTDEDLLYLAGYFTFIKSRKGKLEHVDLQFSFKDRGDGSLRFLACVPLAVSPLPATKRMPHLVYKPNNDVAREGFVNNKAGKYKLDGYEGEGFFGAMDGPLSDHVTIAQLVEMLGLQDNVEASGLFSVVQMAPKCLTPALPLSVAVLFKNRSAEEKEWVSADFLEGTLPGYDQAGAAQLVASPFEVEAGDLFQLEEKGVHFKLFDREGDDAPITDS